MNLIRTLGLEPQSMPMLLSEFGKWSRFRGCKGYPQAERVIAGCSMDDEAGMLIDRALVFLKGRNVNLYNLIKLRYIRGLQPKQIKALMLDPAKCKKYFTEEISKQNLKYLSYEAIDRLVTKGEAEILEILQQIQKLAKV